MLPQHFGLAAQPPLGARRKRNTSRRRGGRTIGLGKLKTYASNMLRTSYHNSILTVTVIRPISSNIAANTPLRPLGGRRVFDRSDCCFAPLLSAPGTSTSFSASVGILAVGCGPSPSLGRRCRSPSVPAFRINKRAPRLFELLGVSTTRRLGAPSF